MIIDKEKNNITITDGTTQIILLVDDITNEIYSHINLSIQMDDISKYPLKYSNGELCEDVSIISELFTNTINKFGLTINSVILKNLKTIVSNDFVMSQDKLDALLNNKK